MLGRLVSARVKTADQAFQAGRLDDAFRMATAPDLAAEPGVQKMLSKLGQQFFVRAERHYQAGRLLEALQDLAKAGQAGGAQPRISDMIAIVQAALDEEARQRKDRLDRVAAAQERMAAGSLHAARAILDGAVQGDPEAGRLKEHIERQESKAAVAFHEAIEHMQHGRWSAAVERFRAGKALDPKSSLSAACEKQLVDGVLQHALGSLRAGHLARGLEELRLLNGIGAGLGQRHEHRRLQRQIETAAEALQHARYGQARRALLSLQQILPDAAWVSATCNQLKELDELVTQLYAGPLGLACSEAGTAAPADAGLEVAGAPQAAVRRVEEAPAAGRAPGIAGALPSRLILWVDGAGSFMLLRKNVASIGRAAARAPADIPLISDLSEHHAELHRVEEDYFVRAAGEVRIGSCAVRHALLQDGDRIILGARARLVFKLPSRKSTSAVLDLSGSARMPHDVRRVVLFDKLVLLNRTPQAHVMVPSAVDPLVLFERDGRLWIRLQDQPGAPPVEVVLERPMDVGGVSLVIEPWTTAA